MYASMPPTGAQYTIDFGDLHATVCEVGATLRSFKNGSSPILFGFDMNEMASGGRGQVLFPWPNRLEDGRFEFQGVIAQAAIDEISTNCAIHGLVRWSSFAADEVRPERVSLSTILHPQPGFPFRARIAISYQLSKSGLQVDAVVENMWHAPIPFGLGFHPYFAGNPTIDRGSVVVPAKTHLLLDRRSLPYGHERADNFRKDGLAFDLKGTRPDNDLEGTVLDDCFTDLELDADRRWRARFFPSAGEGEVVIWGDESFRYVMCFTGDTLDPPDRRRGIAIEPMTCPPNALRSGEGLITVEPGRKFSCSLGVAIVG